MPGKPLAKGDFCFAWNVVAESPDPVCDIEVTESGTLPLLRGAVQESWLPSRVSERVLRRPLGRAVGWEGEDLTFISTSETAGVCARRSRTASEGSSLVSCLATLTQQAGEHEGPLCRGRL